MNPATINALAEHLAAIDADHPTHRMSVPYEQIERIADETRMSVIAAGHDIRLCVWEFSPSIWFTICRWHSENSPSIPASSPGPYRGTYMGIPVRNGVTEEGRVRAFLKTRTLHGASALEKLGLCLWQLPGFQPSICRAV